MLASERGDTLNPLCPARLVLDRIGDKWAMLIINRLFSEGPLRFNEMRRQIGGISQKMLSQTLKNLERDGLITRKAIATVPVTVEYDVTPLGKGLAGIVSQLTNWAEDNLTPILNARARFGTGSTAAHRDTSEGQRT